MPNFEPKSPHRICPMLTNRRCKTLPQLGKEPDRLIWSRVPLKPYRSTARMPARNPSPYIAEGSVSIWCLKNSPSFFSKSVFSPFFAEEDVEEGVAVASAAAAASAATAAASDVVAMLLLEPDTISDSSQRWARTWQMPSSTSGLRIRYPINKEKISIRRCSSVWWHENRSMHKTLQNENRHAQ